MNPYVLLAATAAILGVVWGAHRHGYQQGQEECQLAALRDEHVASVAADAAASAAANAISKIEVQRVTINRQVEREVVEKPVYRDCHHSPDGLRNVNAALTGSFEPAAPASSVPSAVPAGK